MQQPKPLLVRVKGYQPGEDGINVMVCLGPNTDKAKFERFLGEENPIMFLGHPPAEVLTSNKKPQLKGGELSKLAGKFCKDPLFFDFLMSINEVFNSGSHARNETECTKRIYALCGIKSRKELDHNKEAAQEFHERIRKPYHAWLQEQKG